MSDEINEQVYSIWLGKKFVSIGFTRKKGNELMFKRVGNLIGGYTPVLANATEVPFQDRQLWHPKIGDTGQKVRVYFSDLRLDKYIALANPQDVITISHLTRENEALHQEIERLFTMLHDVSNEDRWKKRIKKEVEAYSAIRGYGYGQGQGYGFSPFGGGGVGMPPLGGGFGGNPDENNMP